MKIMEQTINNPAKTVLQNVVDKLINTLSTVATRNKSSFVNDIPSKLDIGTDENGVISVINGLLRSVINNSRESCIRISAKEMYGKMVTISVKDSNSFNTYAVACSLQDVVPLAEKLGGRLDIISERRKETTIAFRFPLEQPVKNSSLPVFE
jgi:signal transduction histidine kinase